MIKFAIDLKTRDDGKPAPLATMPHMGFISAESYDAAQAAVCREMVRIVGPHWLVDYYFSLVRIPQKGRTK